MRFLARFGTTLGPALLALASLALALLAVEPTAAAATPLVEPPVADEAHLPVDTAMSAVIQANGGNLPRSGEELWKALCKLGKFSQLPIPFSSVRLSSGIDSPRIVIVPSNKSLSFADVTEINFDGRLYLAANMERRAVGNPWVTTVEFISWNGSRRAYDFGLIENMGTREEPSLRVVDGGRCFACHKNRGPILGVRPWSNSAHDDIIRYEAASRLQIIGTQLPFTGPFALPKQINGNVLPNRVDGMALASSEAPDVNDSVRRGAVLATKRDTFRLVARFPEGRKVLQILMVAITEPGVLDPNDRKIKQQVDAAFVNTFLRFADSWYEMMKVHKLNSLVDIDPSRLLINSGVRPVPRAHVSMDLVSVPGLVGGNGSVWVVKSPKVLPNPINVLWTEQMRREAYQTLAKKQAELNFVSSLEDLKNYDKARMMGRHGMSSKMQPSNPHSFIRPQIGKPRRPSDLLNAFLLAETIGLADGDRRFFAHSLEAAAKRCPKPTKPATLAKEVFASKAFADFFAGGPLPDRDDFKDRFVEGLDDVLRNHHGLELGFAPERKSYASGPRFDPKAVEERERAIVPTSACLRCHEIRRPGKGPHFDLIPTLAFDPFDKPGREAWFARAGLPAEKQAVLHRMIQRLGTDADMPPTDSPEHELFKVKNAAEFAMVKQTLVNELARLRGKKK